MNKTEKIFNILTKVDAFGQPISFYIKGKTKHKTSFGGLITLIISITILTLTINYLNKLIKKSQVATSQKTSYELDPPFINLTQNNFMFSIGLLDKTLTFNQSIFSYDFTLITEYQMNNSRIEIPFSIRPCQKKDYGNKILHEFDIENTICPDNFSYNIQGGYKSDIYQYIKIEVKQCINGYNPFLTCASKDFINNYFQQNNYVKLDLHFVNRVIDLSNQTYPYKTFMDTQIWYLNSLGKLVRVTNIFFQLNQFESYDDIMGIYPPILYESATYQKERIDNDYAPLNNYTKYAFIYLCSSNYREYYTRSYGDILQVISFIGGIVNVLMMSLGFLVILVNKHKYKISIMNELYDFELGEYTGPNRYNTVTHRSNETLNMSDTPLNATKVKQKFDKIQSMRSRLIYPIKIFFEYIFFCFRSKLFYRTTKLYNLAKKQLAKDMDIIWIMKRIQDIEKLKNILLYPDKLRIFDFVPQPIITADDHIKNLHTLTKLIRRNSIIKSKQNQIIPLNELDNLSQDLNQYYKCCDLYTSLKKSQDQISQNLILSLDPEIVEMFECIEEENNMQKINIIPVSSILKTDNNENIKDDSEMDEISKPKYDLEISSGAGFEDNLNQQEKNDIQKLECSIYSESRNQQTDSEKFLNQPNNNQDKVIEETNSPPSNIDQVEDNMTLCKIFTPKSSMFKQNYNSNLTINDPPNSLNDTGG